MTTPNHENLSAAKDNSAPTVAAGSKTMHSKTFKWLVAILLELIILIGVFALGLRVGFHKADFTKSWASNYQQNFGVPGRNFTPPPPDNGQFFNAHGVFGMILSTDKNGLVIKDQDNDEKIVIVEPTAAIRQNSQTLTLKDLKANEQVIILGSANNQGQIEAKFIRVINQ